MSSPVKNTSFVLDAALQEFIRDQVAGGGWVSPEEGAAPESMSSSRRRARVFYTVAAERDLAAIAAYTLEIWGMERRERDLAMLEETCEQIIPAHRTLAREVPERPGIFRWRAESHVIFFRDVDGGLEILHDSRLASRHL